MYTNIAEGQQTSLVLSIVSFLASNLHVPFLFCGCAVGGVFHSHISLCDATGVADSWVDSSWSFAGSCVLPVP